MESFYQELLLTLENSGVGPEIQRDFYNTNIKVCFMSLSEWVTHG